MELVATLITDPDREDLTERKVTTVLDALKASGWSASPASWLNSNVACDIFFHGATLEEARDIARRDFSNTAFDLVIQPAENRRRMLLLADMDSTIVVGETLDELADKAGIKDQVAEITARAMRGELDFKAALFERVNMLKNLPVDRLDQTLAGIILTQGARTLVQTMRAHGAYTVLVSGGFRFFTRHVAAITGFHEDHANDLIIENERLTGRVAEPILDRETKLALLNRYVAERKIPLSASLTTGDGANDLPMIQAAGLGVAYHAKPVVEAEAPAAIRNGDLTALLYLQGYKFSEFRN
jgi:phosphoserine phosphatase